MTLQRAERNAVTENSDFYCDFVLNGKIKVTVERETADVLAFHHTRPSYPLHIVIVPKAHVTTLTDLDDLSVIQEIFQLAQSIIRERGLNEANFRIITNGGRFQDSKHLHFHLISANPV